VPLEPPLEEMPLRSLGLEAEVAVVAADLPVPEVEAEVAVDATAEGVDPTDEGVDPTEAPSSLLLDLHLVARWGTCPSCRPCLLCLRQAPAKTCRSPMMRLQGAGLLGTAEARRGGSHPENPER